MSTRRFTLGIGPGEDSVCYWMTVVLYESTADLRRAAIRHRPQSNALELAECGGCFQAANSGHPTYLGIMRLSKEYLTVEAVVHESVHAALVHAQKTKSVDRLHLDAWSDGARIIDNEETLAYSVHGISSALLRELKLCA